MSLRSFFSLVSNIWTLQEKSHYGWWYLRLLAWFSLLPRTDQAIDSVEPIPRSLAFSISFQTGSARSVPCWSVSCMNVITRVDSTGLQWELQVKNTEVLGGSAADSATGQRFSSLCTTKVSLVWSGHKMKKAPSGKMERELSYWYRTERGEILKNKKANKWEVLNRKDCLKEEKPKLWKNHKDFQRY